MIIDTGLKRLIQQALREDVGAGDITTTAVIPKGKQGSFVIMANAEGVVCGLNITEFVFETVDGSIRFKPLVNEGTKVQPEKALAYVEGACRGIMTAERTALNFLGMLSGVSTLTNKFVEAVKGTKAQILDTRKTIPAIRRLQKYAVSTGGGKNHRMGLHDQILIKDNHISCIEFKPTIAKSRRDAMGFALDKAKRYAPRGSRIEVEVETLEMLKAALVENPDIIMLDNMSIDEIREAVKIRDSYRIRAQDIGFKVLLEVSGNISIGNVREVAGCGVDRISIGALTHSAPAFDVSLEPR